MPNYQEMSVEELNDVLAGRNAQTDAFREDTLAIRKIRDAKAAQDTAAAKLAAMSDEERAALAQLIAPAGITAGENVGEQN
ncbi:MAG TPA: hypothetical protein PLD20_12925 [Blastocatellia bacterium]|nr:hypothetical protein [Blastocatellia bacterium]HMX28606.1 hypothetical protein [Blastocatellia bacterium]HMY70274.1 hypothetical protein [Blastocatellia bacterium]HMZ18831.1 hypothetical protein [Blastocatellia bacterium]HNG31845.1 hypothetical protein [Blastocatellia bacterium]